LITSSLALSTSSTSLTRDYTSLDLRELFFLILLFSVSIF